MSEDEEVKHFKVSAGLKNILGRELINDEYIAVFELVKNSYDAGAHNVSILVKRDGHGEQSITVSDDGSGMSRNDIVNKWLFVAYSEKNARNNPDNYRHNIKRQYAGAKGVGRFSCDRLGKTLKLITKKQTEEFTYTVAVNWNDFENDDKEEFGTIPVTISTDTPFADSRSNGTTIVISALRDEWDRTKLLRLRQALAQLVNPDSENKDDSFTVEVFAPDEIDGDKKVHRDKTGWERQVVNGVIHNDVFEKMGSATVKLEVRISSDGKTIQTTLFDREEFIFEIQEKNHEYPLLHDISTSIFYLNRSAKVNFIRRVGVRSVDYGSVFIYKNGFRISGYGNPGEDFLSIDRRKAQGHNRYLGTREIMGKISIHGENSDFIETTSRAHGFVMTQSVDELNAFFLSEVLKVLERYVVNIIYWGEPVKSDPEKKVLEPGDVEQQIFNEFGRLGKRKDIISIHYNTELFHNATPQPDSLRGSLAEVERIAAESNDDSLHELAGKLKSRTIEVLSQNESLANENEKAAADLRRSQLEKEVKSEQVYFLQNLADQSTKNLINGMHSIYTSTEVVRGYLQDLSGLLENAQVPHIEQILESIGEMAKANSKANKISELAIKGNKDLTPVGSNDVEGFIREYVASSASRRGIEYVLANCVEQHWCRFDPVEIGIIIDNVASNSLKAHADQLKIEFEESDSFVVIRFLDNGTGLNSEIPEQDIFDYGFSSSRHASGFGIGLNQIRQLVAEMGGKTRYMSEYSDGFGLEVTIRK